MQREEEATEEYSRPQLRFDRPLTGDCEASYS